MFSLDQARPGDVMVFEGIPGDLIDDLISQLTGDTVTHGAIYEGDQVLMDANVEGICRHACAQTTPEDPKGRVVHFCRLNANGLPPTPVLKAAWGYVAEGDGYNWTGLLLTALILLYREKTPANPSQRLVTWLLRRVASHLDTYINDHLEAWTNGKVQVGPNPMFCSQFAFQCYEDAPTPYHLQLRQGDILLYSGRPCLLDEIEAAQGLESLRPDAEPPVGMTDQALARQLLNDLQVGLAREEAVDGTLVEATLIFERALRRATLRVADGTDPLPFQFLKAQKAMFVTPSDLLRHCQNLSEVGSLPLLRDSAVLPPVPAAPHIQDTVRG